MERRSRPRSVRRHATHHDMREAYRYSSMIGRRVLIGHACGLLLAVGGCATAYSPRTDRIRPLPALVIVGASVVDLSNGAPAPATIVVENGHITRIGPPERIAIPPGAERVDATGAYVIPGLWDMHAHTTYATAYEVEQAFFGALVAHGVIAIRDLASRFPMQQILRWRAAINARGLIGPQIVAVGRVVDARPITIGTVLARNEDEARHAVELVKQQGYDFVKPYNDLGKDTYLALSAHALHFNFPIAGHLPYAVDAITAAEAGQRSIEHLTNLWFETATAEDQIRARITAGVTRGESPVALYRAKIDSLFPLAFQTYDAAKVAYGDSKEEAVARAQAPGPLGLVSHWLDRETGPAKSVASSGNQLQSPFYDPLP
ncbi:MAG: hypothetical protein ABIW79_06310 [Gemmatimonas sp.]